MLKGEQRRPQAGEAGPAGAKNAASVRGAAGMGESCLHEGG